MCRTIQNTRWLCYGTRRCRPRNKHNPSLEIRPPPFLESCDKRDPVTGVCHGDVGGQQQRETEVVLSCNDDGVAVVFDDDDDDGDDVVGIVVVESDVVEGGVVVGDTVEGDVVGGDVVKEESGVVWDDVLDDDDDSAVFYKTLECPKHHKQRLANLKEVWYVFLFFCSLLFSTSPPPHPRPSMFLTIHKYPRKEKKEGRSKARETEERRGVDLMC